MRSILSQCETTSGQVVNLKKSNIYFSPNTPSNLKNYIRNIFGIYNPIDHGRYLGLLSLNCRGKRVVFAFMKDALRRRLQGCSRRFLLKAGKEILNNSVAQSLPTFCMSIFHIPITSVMNYRNL